MKRSLCLLIIALFGVSSLSKKCGTTPSPSNSCHVGGCSSQLCTDDPNAISTCEWRAEYACYQDATCERQRNGQCGWTSTRDLRQCLRNPPAPCHVGGCSSELCTDDPTATSICEWRDEFACYQGATCERQRNGECGWTSNAELQDCLENPPQAGGDEPIPDDYCFITGCSGTVCSSEREAPSTCEWRDEFVCYQGATCERQRNGECGWTSNAEFEDCLENPPQASGDEPIPDDYCFITGCSGTVCSSEREAPSTCEWRDEYVCYQSATCERQRNGDCGWTSNAEFEDCLDSPPSST